MSEPAPRAGRRRDVDHRPGIGAGGGASPKFLCLRLFRLGRIRALLGVNIADAQTAPVARTP